MYLEAIALTPLDCAPQAYLTELHVQMGNKTAADLQFAVACNVCGKTPHSLDIADVRAAYAAAGMAIPSGSPCSPAQQNSGSSGEEDTPASSGVEDIPADSSAAAVRVASVGWLTLAVICTARIFGSLP